MGTRDVVRMYDHEVAAFLREHLKAQVATVGKDGAPHLSTLFYVLDDAGRIAFWTYARSQKIRNLERDARVSCLVEDGDDYFALRGASITGTAEIVRDTDRLREIGSAVACRMAGVADLADLGELGMSEVERQVAKRVAVVIHPDHVATWDHAKLLAGTGERK
ncbi:pyridoxamine 5'-phosphate oxidase family protein [Nocardioides pacificus]